MNDLLSASSVESRSEKDHSDDEDTNEPMSGAQVLKKLNLRKQSFKCSEGSMDINQEMSSSDCYDYPKPQNKKKAKRSLTSKNFKFGSSKSLISDAKQLVLNIEAKGLQPVNEDADLSAECEDDDGISADSLSEEGESPDVGQQNLLSSLNKLKLQTMKCPSNDEASK